MGEGRCASSSHLEMALPSKEEACLNAVDVLGQILAILDLHTAARAMLNKAKHSAVPMASPVEETVMQNSQLVCEHATALLSKLGPGFRAASANGVVGGSSSALPKITDLPLFVQKLHLLHERVQRVSNALGGLKHVRVLSEGSAGRRIITERASLAMTQLLDVLRAVEKTLEETPSPPTTGRGAARSRYVLIDSQGSAGCLGVTSAEFPRAARDKIPISETHRDTSPRSTPPENRPRQQQCNEHSPRQWTTTRSRLAGEKNEVEEKKDDEVSETSSSSCEGNQSLSLQKRESNATFSSHSCFFTIVSSGHADSLETIASAHCIPLEELCAINTHLLAYKHKPLPPQKTVRVPIRADDPSALVPSSVTRHTRIFRGKLWRELLRNDNPAFTSRWKELFIQEVVLLFGIPRQWVSDVQLVNEPLATLTGGDQEVMFDVRLPLSLEADEVNTRIQQHEFMSMLLLYEELQKTKADEEEGEAGGNLQSDATSFVSAASCENPESMSPPEFLNTASPNSDADASDSRSESGGAEDYHNCPGSKLKKDRCLPDTFAAVIDKEALLRDALTVREKYSRRLVMKMSTQNQHVQGDEWQDGPNSFDESPRPHGKHAEEQGPRSGASDASDEASPFNSVKTHPPHALPPLPPRSSTLSCHGPVSAFMLDGGNAEVSSPSPSPVRTDYEMDDANHKVMRIFSNGGLSPNPNLPENSERAFVLCPKKTWEPTVQWFYTSHEKVIAGERWDLVLEREENELRRTFIAEVAALFDLPEENVTAVEFVLGSLHATFDLMHDRYLKGTEIDVLLSVFDFPRVRGLYHRCVGVIDACSPGPSDNMTGSSDEKRNVDAPCIQLHSSSANDATDTDMGLLKNESTGENSCGHASEGSLALSGRQMSPVRLSMALVRENTATPDNEPVTFAHLALLHDLTVDALVEANPHLATFGSNDSLPSSANIVIPRLSLDDDACDFKEGCDERDVSSTAPSVVSQTTSRFSTAHEDDNFRSKVFMNARDVARKVDMSPQALRQRNTHFHPHGDLERPPSRTADTTPRESEAAKGATEALAGQFPGYQGPAMPAAVGEGGRAAVILPGNGGGEKVVGLGVESTPPKKLTEKTVNGREQALTTGLKPQGATQKRLHEFAPLHQDITQQSFARPQRYGPRVDDVPDPCVKPSMSRMRNAAVPRDCAVLLMMRSTEQFILLRFFAKWRYMAQIRRGHRRPMTVQGAPLKGSQAKRPIRTEALNAQFQAKTSSEVLTSEPVAPPRTRTVRGPNAELIAKTMEAIARTENRGVVARDARQDISLREKFSFPVKQRMHGEGFVTRVLSAAAPMRTSGSDRGFQAPFKSAQSDARMCSRSPSSCCSAPRRTFSGMSSDNSRRSSSPLIQVSNVVHDSRTSERPPLGICVSSLLTIIEVYGEAEAAGIQRGDQLREVEGHGVRTVKEFRDVLASIEGTHVCVGILKKSGGALITVRLRRGWRDTVESEESASTNSSPSEPRIVPMLSPARSTVLASAMNHRRGAFVPRGRPQSDALSNKLEHGA